VPPETGVKDLVPWLRGYRAKLQSARNYLPDVYPGRITLLKPDEKPTQSGGPETDSNDDASIALWRDVSSEPVEVHAVAGTHHTMILEPHVSVLAERLRECIQRAIGSNGRAGSAT
jgi:thioesterase domain-containing protein